MTKTKTSKTKKPLKVYALLREDTHIVIQLYRRQADAIIDQQYLTKFNTIIWDYTLEDQTMWRHWYKQEMENLDKELKEHEKRINKQHAALRSALSCGEERSS